MKCSDIRRKMKKMKITVVRCRMDHSLGMSKPCAQCEQCIKKCGIKKIYYSNESGNITYEKSNAFQSDFLTSGYLKKYDSR